MRAYGLAMVGVLAVAAPLALGGTAGRNPQPAAATASATSGPAGGATATAVPAPGPAGATPPAAGTPGGVTAALPTGFVLERVLTGLDAPVAAAVDPTGQVVVAEEGGGGTILRLAPDGRVTTLAQGGFPLPVGGLVATGDAVVVAAGGDVIRLSAAGGREPLAVGLHGPLTGLALGPDGRVYVGVLGTGHVAAVAGPGSPVQVVADGLQGPAGVAFGPDGRLYVVDDGPAGDAVAALTPGSGPARVAPLAVLPPADAAAGLALAAPGSPFAAFGQAFVAVAGGVAAVDASSGQMRPFLADGGSGSPVRPVDVVFAADGQSLYVVDAGQVIAGLPVPGTGALWRIVAAAPAAPAPAAPAPAAQPAPSPTYPPMQVTPEPGPQNKVRPAPAPAPWYQRTDVLYGAIVGLLVLAAALLVRFRRRV
jgi:glucose/arabinose dehydrogenase